MLGGECARESRGIITERVALPGTSTTSEPEGKQVQSIIIIIPYSLDTSWKAHRRREDGAETRMLSSIPAAAVGVRAARATHGRITLCLTESDVLEAPM